jgi:hypothetical protein
MRFPSTRLCRRQALRGQTLSQINTIIDRFRFIFINRKLGGTLRYNGVKAIKAAHRVKTFNNGKKFLFLLEEVRMV